MIHLLPDAGNEKGAEGRLEEVVEDDGDEARRVVNSLIISS
jgi:hypothetical protein